MASIVLTLAGSAAGNALLPGIGGAVLGGLGGAVGGLIDGAIFGAGSSHHTVRAPRLDQLRIQDSSYGSGIPIIYGRNRLAGNVIWASELIETLSSEDIESGGGKGGGGSATTTVERASYAVDCAIAIGQGPIGGIGTIWADGKVVYSGAWKPGLLLDAEFHLGSPTQAVSPLMQAALEADAVPAYRGICYVVLHRLQLGDFGNRLPNFTFEVLPPATSAPQWQGDVFPNLLGRPSSFANASALPPLTLKKRGSQAAEILASAIEQSGSNYRFVAIVYDVGGGEPVELARITSAWITRTGDLYDFSWGLSPDGRHVVFYMQHFDASNSITLAIFDASTRQFGALHQDSFAASISQIEIRWLDAQHLVIPDSQSTTRGLKLYLAQGRTLISMGFHGIWGAGSTTSRAILPFAQFAPLPGGLLCLMANHDLAPTAFYARSLRWAENALQTGGETTLLSGVSAFSAPRNRLMALGNNEFALARHTTAEIRLFSFIFDYAAFSVTRGLASLVPSVTGDMSLNYANGVIGFLQKQSGHATYRYGEIALEAGSFSISQPGALIAGTYNGTATYFSFFALDSLRCLMLAGDNGDGFSKIAIFLRGQNAASLAGIVANLLARAGYAASDYNVAALNNVLVSGYTVAEPGSARGALEPLQAYAPFDLVENDGVLLARLHASTPDLALAESDLRATREGEEAPPRISLSRAHEQDLPREVTVDYIDPVLDYQKGSQRARRLHGSAHMAEQIRLPIVCTATAAKGIAQQHPYRRWLAREEATVTCARRYMVLTPGDVVTLAARNMRIIVAEQAGSIVRIRAVPVSGYMAGSGEAGDSAQGGTEARFEAVETMLYLMDLPPLRAADDAPGFYAAATGSANWRGAGLYRATDGVTFTQSALFGQPATAGIATSLLASAPALYADEANSVKVALLSGTLTSCTQTEWLDGANAALLGNEIIQFRTAILNGDGSYTLSGLLRGRRGTEAGTGSHALSERFVLLNRTGVIFVPVPTALRGRSSLYRGVSLGQEVGLAPDHSFTHPMAVLCPLAPVHVAASRNASGDVSISWIRRARINAEWQDHIDVPLDESEERYELLIMNGAAVARSLSLASPSYVYSAAEQIADFGALQASLAIRLYQISSRYGRGGEAQANL